ncbi:MAG: hypothetical protein QOG30_2763 [Acidimicrobiaceae bacterium]|jgi:hypothetical protein
MTTATRSGHRTATAAVLAIGGGAVAAASWAGGDHGLAVGLVVFYAVAAVIAFAWSGGRGDVAAIMRVGGDERQRSLDRDATAITGIAMSLAAIAGAVVETARSLDPGPYGVMCAVGGITYCVSLIIVRHRRS